MKNPFQRLRIVLVRTEEAGNIGATARVIRNFGMSQLVLVTPSGARPREAYKWARGAEDVLEGATYADSLHEALQGCSAVWGTTRRVGKARGKIRLLGEAATTTVDMLASGQEVAWVFGPESRGLATEEMRQCTGRVTIPTTGPQPSMNLSHAVGVCAYALAERALNNRPRSLPKLASWEARQDMYAHLQAALLAVDFMDSGQTPAKMDQLRGILERCHLTPDETRFLRGIARKMNWAGSLAKKETHT